MSSAMHRGAWLATTIMAVLAGSAIAASSWADVPSAPVHVATPSEYRIVAKNYRGGEGPTLLPDGTVAFTGGPGQLLGLRPDGQLEVLLPAFGAVGTAAARGQPNIIYGGRMDMSRITGGPGTPLKPRAPDSKAPPGAILKADLTTKQVTPLYTQWGNGNLLVGPNKLVVDDHGDIWFTDVLEGWIYWARSDGSAIKRVLAFPVAHGITLSPDHRTLYVSSETQLIALQIKGHGKVAMKGGEPVVKVIAQLDPKWNVDGIRTDTEGNIVMACWGAGVIALSPQGKIISHIQLPGLLVTNLVFGGPGLHTLYLTAHSANAPPSAQSGQLVALDWTPATAGP